MRRAVVIGEALVDVVAGGDAHPGGSPLNVAVGLARLGLPTTLYTRFGNDEYGSLIRDHLDASGVTLGDDSVHGSRTSTAVVELDDEGRADYAFDLVTELPSPGVARAALVHAGSIAAFLEPGAAVVREAFADADADTLLSFDPNIRPEVMGEHEQVLAGVEAYAGRVHVVKLSDEDAAWLYPSLGLEDVLARLVELGTRLAVVTRGGEGCLALAAGAGAAVARAAQPVDLVDTIGAGDAFMSGLLGALLFEQSGGEAGAGHSAGRDAGRDPGHGSGSVAAALVAGDELSPTALERVLDTALASAAITVSRAGANPPSGAELDALLAPDPRV